MANTDSSWGSTIVKGVGALLAALVLFVLEQYIQHRYWPGNPAVIAIDGRVIDALGSKVIGNAVVDINVNGLHEDQNTDTDGRYAFSLEGFDPSTAASMTVKAQGYKDETINLLLSAMEADKELKLEASAPVAGGGGAAATWVGPTPTIRPLAAAKYVRRFDPKVLVAHR